MRTAKLDLIGFGRVARTDMLAAMAMLPDGIDVLRPRLGLPLVLANTYASAQHVLVADDESYRKPWIVRQVIEEGLGTNLFTSEGDRWLARRKPIAPVFALTQVDDLVAIMAAAASEATSTWADGEVDIQSEMTSLTIQVALRALLGTTDADNDVAVAVTNSFTEILDWVSYRLNNPLSLPAVIPTPRNTRMRSAQSALRSAIRDLIAERRSAERESVDVLGQLLRAQDGETDLTDDMIADECIGFLFAGHETTAATLTWSLYELAMRPDLQDAVGEEGRAFASSAGTFERVEAMTTTSGVVEEALRLYPAGISIVRSAKRTTSIGDVTIRRGTMVMIPVYAVQRSATAWEDPERFDPTRDHGGNGDGFMPFGLGPRRCLGARFARAELRVVLGLLCSHWRFTYDRPTPPEPTVAPSLRAKGALPLGVTRR